MDPLKCGNCGAFAPPPAPDGAVACSYCGLNLVAATASLMVTAPMVMSAPVATAAARPVAATAGGFGAPAQGGFGSPFTTSPGGYNAPGGFGQPTAPEAAGFDFSEASVCDVARRAMGLHGSLFYAPELPSGKEKGARSGCASAVPAKVPILALYDDTLFGGADDGFVMTTWGLLWKNIGDDPDRLEWREIDPSSIKVTDSGVSVNGHEIQMSKEELRKGFAGAVAELAGYAQ